MRQIKFRCWDKEEEYFDSILAGNILSAIHGSGDHLSNEETNRYILQQYTGLKDKNGEEIYEGDIVKATSDQYENENFVGKVIFDEGCFLTWINKNDIRGIWGEDDIEVIGNIFETPELLKS